jgi:hypothetical protein
MLVNQTVLFSFTCWTLPRGVEVLTVVACVALIVLVLRFLVWD